MQLHRTVLWTCWETFLKYLQRTKKLGFFPPPTLQIRSSLKDYIRSCSNKQGKSLEAHLSTLIQTHRRTSVWSRTSASAVFGGITSLTKVWCTCVGATEAHDGSDLRAALRGGWGLEADPHSYTQQEIINTASHFSNLIEMLPFHNKSMHPMINLRLDQM